MLFTLRKYDITDAPLVDSWLDDEAILSTGIEEGWQAFYEYWMSESDASEKYEDHCYLVCNHEEPFAIIYLAGTGREVTVSEFIVAPHMRGKGYGSAAIRYITNRLPKLFSWDITVCKTVIFPNNIASQKAFEKAGFSLTSTHRNGTALYYTKTISN